jgi:hypothetical protein
LPYCTIARDNTAILQRLAPERVMTERTIRANGIDLWTEDFGDRRKPPVLLIMGASAQGIYWPDEFVQSLVAEGRYDNRDRVNRPVSTLQHTPIRATTWLPTPSACSTHTICRRPTLSAHRWAA